MFRHSALPANHRCAIAGGSNRSDKAIRLRPAASQDRWPTSDDRLRVCRVHPSKAAAKYERQTRHKNKRLDVPVLSTRYEEPKACTSENSHRYASDVRGKQDPWRLRQVDTTRSSPGVVVDCCHTLPRFRDRVRGKYFRHRRPNSTSNSTPAVRVELTARVTQLFASHVAPFSGFNHCSLEFKL